MRPIVIALLLSIVPLSTQAQVFRRVQPTRQPVYVQPRVYRPAPQPTRPQPPAERAAAAPALTPAAAAEPAKDPHLNVPLAAEREIARLGDGVQEIGTGHQGAETLWMAAVAAPPPDDSHKWYLTVITKRNCVYCEKLLADFARDPNLRAFADPREYEQSWAHFNVFSSEDATQKWRWAKIRVDAYPTLILQPPLNRKFGDPKTVVLQKTGYDGDPAKLAEEIRQAIKYYVSRLDGGHQEGGFEQAIVDEKPIGQSNPKLPPAPEPAAAIGIDPPFPVPVLPPAPGPDTAPLRPDRPSGPPVIPRIVPDSVRPKILPDMDLPGLATIVSILIAIRWACGVLIALLTSGGITNLFLLLILLVLLIRLMRARRALDLVVDDSLLQRMAATLAAMLPRPAHRPVPPAQNSRPSPAAASPAAPSVPPAAQEKQRPTISRARVRIR